MTSDPNLVDQIVAAVGRRLEAGLSDPAGPAEAVANEIVCRELIVTGELLAGRISPEVRLVRISAGAILTPTAQELVEKNELTKKSNYHFEVELFQESIFGIDGCNGTF